MIKKKQKTKRKKARTNALSQFLESTLEELAVHAALEAPHGGAAGSYDKD